MESALLSRSLITNIHQFHPFDVVRSGFAYRLFFLEGLVGFCFRFFFFSIQNKQKERRDVDKINSLCLQSRNVSSFKICAIMR